MPNTEAVAENRKTSSAIRHSSFASRGDVAQLGERRVRNAKVVGSSPIVSSSKDPICATARPGLHVLAVTIWCAWVHVGAAMGAVPFPSVRIF